MENILQIMLHHHWLTGEQADEVLARQKELGLPLEKILPALPFIDAEQLAQAIALQLRLPYCKPAELPLSPELLAALSPRQAEKFQVVPVGLAENRLTLATAEPLKLEAIDTLRELLPYKIKLAVASAAQIRTAIQRFYGASLESVAAVLEDLNDAELTQYSSDSGAEIAAIASETMAAEAPIIRLVNTLISGAFKAGASDIHLEPFEDEIKVRYRVDGVLQETAPPPKNLFAAVISRIKLMAGMDITERRIPQDGRIRIQLNGRDLDLRVAVAPTAHGEAAVLRILNRANLLLGLDQLGLSPENVARFEKLIARPHGMILVTGPTGSGKTTTLYAALQKLNEPTRKIITVEDPIEYQLKGVNQMQVNPKLDFTFAQGLRTIVRHDPDIILVGEIRDRETAEMAIQSALTGHLVFATLHTNDAPTAFTRLVDMGVEEFLVASTVCGVLAQRLVRRVCPKCQTPYSPTPQELEIAGPDPGLRHLVRGKGCEHCNGIGYRGQVGLFELLIASEAIERLIMERRHSGMIRERALAEGMTSLRQDGIAKAKQGLTTIAEVMRVTRDG
ncbi:general secretion pathway protein E/type IV pilus assembly protein PilB [Hydrogenispora ethanolica]|uniref:protein-secreting ATPase n=1 Tax=Hydrogenispora ethanolica TaxID=1082276 RepID=A0A4R1QQ58_HYDET|nr:type II secretion system ATPase GspE [Hydrogenispora ethanolica]TCL54495.1 general secretion pathway protein E/type IV pilus assembly protein PilB [Hydrogenispora ethanolica]